MNLTTAWTVTAIFVVSLVLGMFSYIGNAHANPFYTGTKAQSATATSTQTQLRVGFATSTTVYDSYEQYGTNQTNAGNLTLPDIVSFVIDGVASSTASVINAACEYSDNYNGSSFNGDWYQSDIVGATTTTPGIQNVSMPNSFSFTYASSTVGGAGLSGVNTRFQKLIQCQVPTRYVRLVVTNTGAAATVWVQAIPKKQRNSGN